MRLVATDLDGTIVPHGRASVSARTRRAFEACAAAGVRVVFVTGRPARWMGPVIDSTGLGGIAVCSNGAAIYDLVRQQVQLARPIPVDVVREVTERIKAEVADAGFGFDTPDDFRIDPAFAAVDSRRSRVNLGRYTRLQRMTEGSSIEELSQDEPTIMKVLATSPTASSTELLAVAMRHVSHLVSPTHSTSHMTLLEMGPEGVTKASALAELAQEWEIDRSDVVAFGDMPNDIEMLSWAGRGYAMADGHPDVVRLARYVAPPAEADGVARVLEDLLA